MKSLLEFDSVKKFVKRVGDGVEKYAGGDPLCIIALQPHGIFYAEGLFDLLKQKKKNVVLVTMGDDGFGLEEKKIKGRKVLIVDGDIVTGKAYKRSMEALRMVREEDDIKDIKFATYIDRAGLADFSVWNYKAEATWQPTELDALDIKIIALLEEDGRMPFTEIGKKLGISGVTVKSRVEWLTEKKLLEIRGATAMERFYTMSAVVQVDVEQRAFLKLIEKLEKAPEVYHLVKRSASYNLVVGILIRTLEDIENFVEREIRSEQGIRSIDIRVGELPILPKTFSPKIL